jgi:hypothetical protein
MYGDLPDISSDVKGGSPAEIGGDQGGFRGLYGTQEGGMKFALTGLRRRRLEPI